MRTSNRKILTLHPAGKTGVRIDLEKYETIRKTIIAILKRKKKVTFEDLADDVVSKLNNRFEGSILWYYTTVKLDLEARKIIRRVPGSRPQQITLGKKI
jgi:dihydroneopterin aldolase